MAAEQSTPDPAPTAKPEPAADAYDWGPDPPPFTAEEIEDLRRNGIDGSEFIRALIAELEAMDP
ncbi:MAG: hypothetical protein K2X82_32910 [Gemmataceae bacterium]|nr:hypothetical protein [Gemmataceae bacterium]